PRRKKVEERARHRDFARRDLLEHHTASLAKERGGAFEILACVHGCFFGLAHNPHARLA
ncbi:unnamed protein product, partial [Ectocarpus sp. 12 AP-2014]